MVIQRHRVAVVETWIVVRSRCPQTKRELVGSTSRMREPFLSPSTVASCPSSPDRLERTFLPRSAVQFEPVVQVRFCDRPETCSDIDEPLAEILSSPSSSDPDVTAGSLLSAKNASPETYGEGLSISDWQGVVFETGEMLGKGIVSITCFDQNARLKLSTDIRR